MSGSLQLRLYRMARREGVDTEEAATWAGIGAGEARLTDVEDAKRPPEPECYEVPAGMLRHPVAVSGDPTVLTALCGPFGRQAA